eukprot:jgi/Ulvmu1/3716/UM170_0022.1
MLNLSLSLAYATDWLQTIVRHSLQCRCLTEPWSIDTLCPDNYAGTERCANKFDLADRALGYWPVVLRASAHCIAKPPQNSRVIMSGLRGAVTGADGCTTGGAGSSNAMAGLADTLLGTSSKTRSRLQDFSLGQGHQEQLLPGQQHLSIDQAVERLAGPSDAAAASHLPPAGQDAVLNAFEQAFMSGQGPASHGPHASGGPRLQPPQVPQQVLENLQHFLRSGVSRRAFTPLPLPPAPLPLPHALRIRDRGTILARHLHADAGDAYADQQVDSLLRGLGIDPGKLPARAHDMHAAAAGFNAAWSSASARQPGVAAHSAAAAAAQHAVASAAAQASGGDWATEFSGQKGDAWAQQFTGPMRDALPNVTRHHAAHAPSRAWAQEFAATARQAPGIGWAEQFLGGESTGAAAEPAAAAPVDAPGAWAEEFSQHAATREGVLEGMSEGEAAKVHSRRLAEVLQQDPEGKFQRSEFLQFLSKMSQGEVDFQAGNVAQGGAAATGGWAQEFADVDAATREAGIAARRQLAEGAAVGAAMPSSMGAGGAMGVEQTWVEDFQASARADAQEKAADAQEKAAEAAFAEAWASQFEREGVDEWVKDFQGMQARMAEQDAFDNAWADFGRGAAGGAQVSATRAEYLFAESNPFEGNPDALALAQRAFKDGSLADACLALEAVVKANPGDANAWRLLGAAHAENDDDRQAIAAMLRALDAAPGSPDVLLALGVSHVNELHEGEAVGYLMQWLSAHPKHSLAATVTDSVAPSGALSRARDAFARAAQTAPADADVHTALGVTAHLAGDFPAAVLAFEAAVRLRPEDYSLWNKLGATLANSGRSAEAKRAYATALRNKPNYMRAWSNAGISHSNLGEYREAARYFLKALTLNSRAQAVWGYLRTALLMLGDLQAIEVADAKDVRALVQRLGVAEGLPEVATEGVEAGGAGGLGAGVGFGDDGDFGVGQGMDFLGAGAGLHEEGAWELRA